MIDFPPPMGSPTGDLKVSALAPSQFANWQYGSLLRAWGGTEAENRTLNIVRALDFTGALDASALRKAIQDVASRHPIVRARVRGQGGDEAGPFDENVFLEFGGPESVEVLILRLAGDPEMRSTPDTLARTPLDVTERSARFIAVAWDKDRTKWRLYVAMHHMFTDETSMSALCREVREAYGRRKAGQVPDLSPTNSIVALIEEHRAWLNSPVGRSRVHELAALLTHELPCLDLPTLRPRRNHRAVLLRSLDLSDRPLADNLRRVASEAGVTPHILALAAYAACLSSYSQDRCVAIGRFAWGRWWKNPWNDINAYAAATVLRVSVENSEMWPEFLTRVGRQSVTSMLRDQRIPLPYVSEDFRHHWAQPPMYHTWFNFNDLASGSNVPTDTHVRPLDDDDVQLRLVISEEDLTAPFWQYRNPTVEVLLDGDRLGISFQYDSGLFALETIQVLARRFLNLLQSLVEEPSQTVGNALRDMQAADLLTGE